MLIEKGARMNQNETKWCAGCQEGTTKRPVGRPRTFQSPEQMQEAVDQYFEKYRQLSIVGLALFLGFSSRTSLLDYEGYSPEFLNTIKRAKARVEMYYEEHLVCNNVAGSIFALKNFGWQDKIVQERTRDEDEQVEIDEMQAEIKALKSAGDGIPTS